MVKILRFSIQNIRRNASRTTLLVALISIMLAIGLFMEGYLADYNNGWLKSIIYSGLGHVQIMRKGYHEASLTAPLDNLIDNSDTLVNHYENQPHVVGITTRLMLSGLISTEEKSAMFNAIGIDTVREYDLFDLITLREGSLLTPQQKDGCIIGKNLAKQLGLHVGDRTILMANTVQGGLNAVSVVVTGIFESGTSEIDSLVLYIPLPLAQQLGRVPNQVSSIIFLFDSISNVPNYAEAIKHDITTEKWITKPYKLWTWSELAQLYKRISDMQRLQLSLVEGLTIFIIALAIVVIMFMSVFERTRDIGTLSAFGMYKREIIAIYVFEALLIGLVSVIVGVTLALTSIILANSIGIPFNPPGSDQVVYIRPILVFSSFIKLSLLILATTIAGSLYPAYWASKVNPAEALRHV